MPWPVSSSQKLDGKLVYLSVGLLIGGDWFWCVLAFCGVTILGWACVLQS